MKGIKLETYLSKEKLQDQVPVLVSATLLRRYNLGQIDLALMQIKKTQDWFVTLYEIKATPLLSSQQMHRLKNSQSFLAQVFKGNVLFKLIDAQEEAIDNYFLLD